MTSAVTLSCTEITANTTDMRTDNSSAGNIITGVAFLDPELGDDFPTAYQCGINSLTLLATNRFQQISLRPNKINDEINVMGRADLCNIHAFKSYMAYELNVVDWETNQRLEPTTAVM